MNSDTTLNYPKSCCVYLSCCVLCIVQGEELANEKYVTCSDVDSDSLNYYT